MSLSGYEDHKNLKVLFSLFIPECRQNCKTAKKWVVWILIKFIGDLMKPRFFFHGLGLVAILLIVSCAPAIFPPVATEAASNSTQAVGVQAVATSRGPNLQATDPSTVNLAAGQLQLVEFFRFT
jgi:hypothetical protein